jgi:HD superfamily phosphohydrolase YqeK
LKLVERIDVSKIPVSVANLLHDVIAKYNGDTKLTSCLYKKKELKTAIETAI